MEVLRTSIQDNSQALRSYGGSYTTSFWALYDQQMEASGFTAVQRSQDGKGRALDTIFTERLWRTVKYEKIYLQDYQSPREARQGMRD